MWLLRQTDGRIRQLNPAARASVKTLLPPCKITPSPPAIAKAGRVFLPGGRNLTAADLCVSLHIGAQPAKATVRIQVALLAACGGRAKALTVSPFELLGFRPKPNENIPFF